MPHDPTPALAPVQYRTTATRGPLQPQRVDHRGESHDKGKEQT
jgi:hypothetical protein